MPYHRRGAGWNLRNGLEESYLGRLGLGRLHLAVCRQLCLFMGASRLGSDAGNLPQLYAIPRSSYCGLDKLDGAYKVNFIDDPVDTCVVQFHYRPDNPRYAGLAEVRDLYLLCSL